MDDTVLKNIKATILKLDFVPWEQRESLVTRLPMLYALPEAEVMRFLDLLGSLVCTQADLVLADLERDMRTAHVLTNLLNETVKGGTNGNT